MKLRKKDLKLAKSRKYLSQMANHGDRHVKAEAFIRYATDRLKRLGYKLRKKKGPRGWKAARMSTTLRKTVWLGVGWDKRSSAQKAMTLMHELVHANQARGYGFAKWIGRYVGSTRFRFAMEAQAYRESVRTLRAMGWGKSSIDNYVEDLPNRFIKSYWILGRRMRKDVRKHMRKIVMMP